MSGYERCGVTGKVMYPTRDAATGALGGFAYAKGSRRVQRGTCAFCHAYHLTKGERGRRSKGKGRR